MSSEKKFITVVKIYAKNNNILPAKLQQQHLQSELIRWQKAQRRQLFVLPSPRTRQESKTITIHTLVRLLVTIYKLLKLVC